MFFISHLADLLSDIKSLQIKASFGTGTASTFYNVAMDTARASELSSSTDYVTTVENCTCTDNTMGMFMKLAFISKLRLLIY